MSDFFSKLTELNLTRRVEWASDDHVPSSPLFSLTYNALEFMSESGELAEQVKKLIRSKRGLKGNATDLTKIREEIGDVMISLSLLLNGLEEVSGEKFDVEGCARMKFNKTSEKYGFNTVWD